MHSQHYNEDRDAIGDLSSLVWKQVQKEPIVCESTIDDSTSETFIADLRVRGVWEPQVDAIFDVRVVDSLAYKHTMLVLPHFSLVLMVYLVVKQISY